jgi:hypothetical protein
LGNAKECLLTLWPSPLLALGASLEGVIFFLEADLATFLVAAGADIVESDLRIKSLIIYKLEGKKSFY